MPGLAGRRQVMASISQENGAIGLRGYKAPSLESRNGAVDGDMRHAQALGEINHARFACLGDQVSDGFDVILRDLVRMLAPGLRQVLGLVLRTWTRRSSLEGDSFASGHVIIDRITKAVDSRGSI